LLTVLLFLLPIRGEVVNKAFQFLLQRAVLSKTGCTRDWSVLHRPDLNYMLSKSSLNSRATPRCVTASSQPDARFSRDDRGLISRSVLVAS